MAWPTVPECLEGSRLRPEGPGRNDGGAATVRRVCSCLSAHVPWLGPEVDFSRGPDLISTSQLMKQRPKGSQVYNSALYCESQER